MMYNEFVPICTAAVVSDPFVRLLLGFGTVPLVFCLSHSPHSKTSLGRKTYR